MDSDFHNNAKQSNIGTARPPPQVYLNRYASADTYNPSFYLPQTMSPSVSSTSSPDQNKKRRYTLGGGNVLDTIRDGNSIEEDPYYFQPYPQINVQELDKDGVKRVRSQPELSYKLASPYEGAFAFKSKHSLRQPEYPLAFVERNLNFQLEYEDMQAKAKAKQKSKGAQSNMLGKGTSMLGVALRTVFLRKVHEHRQAKMAKIGQRSDLQKGDTMSSNDEMSKFIKQIEQRKQTTNFQDKITSFLLNKVRYYDDRKLPFQLLKEVPRILEKAMQNVNMGKFNKMKKKQDSKKNELEKFVNYNESGLNNVIVYLFWIVVSSLFNDFDHISFPEEFINEIRQALNSQYRNIYFYYLLRLKQHVSDAILEILPFLLAETVKQAIQDKFKNHELPLNQGKTQVLLTGMVFRELHGYETSQLSLEKGRNKFLQHSSTKKSDKISPTKAQQQHSTMQVHKPLKRLASSASQFSNISQNRLLHHTQDSREHLSSAKQKNSSIFNVKTYDVRRDPGGLKQDTCGLRSHTSKCPVTDSWHPQREDFVRGRDYTEEIKADLVNDMIKTYANGIPPEQKQAISDQINEMDDVMSPAEILAEKKKYNVGGSRRQAFRAHYSNSTLTMSFSGRKTMTKNKLVSQMSLRPSQKSKVKPAQTQMQTPMDKYLLNNTQSSSQEGFHQIAIASNKMVLDGPNNASSKKILDEIGEENTSPEKALEPDSVSSAQLDRRKQKPPQKRDTLNTESAALMPRYASQPPIGQQMKPVKPPIPPSKSHKKLQIQSINIIKPNSQAITRNMGRLNHHSAGGYRPDDPSSKTVKELNGILNQLRNRHPIADKSESARQVFSSKTKQEKEEAAVRKFEQRVKSAMLTRQQLDHEKTGHMHKSGRKFNTDDSKHFDLQYVTPTVRSHFKTQLLQSHYPSRKQKQLLVQRETGLDREEGYQELIKEFLKDKETEIKEKKLKEKEERHLEEQERIKALMSEKQQRTVQYGYAREAQSQKLRRQKEEEAAQELAMYAAKKKDEQNNIVGQRRSVKQINTAKNDVANEGMDLLVVTTGDDVATRADTQSRNVKFDMTNPMTTKNSQSTAIFGPSRNQVGRRRSQQHTTAQSATELHKSVYFFQDKDYFEAQKTWELNRINDKGAGKRKTMMEPSRIDILSDEQKRRSTLMFKKPALRIGTPQQQNRGGVVERNQYEHNLHYNISKSIKGKTRNNKEDSKLERQNSHGSSSFLAADLPKMKKVPLSTKSQKNIAFSSKQIRCNTHEDKLPKKMNSQVNPLFESQIKRPLSKDELEEIQLAAPYDAKDIGMQLTRMTSKILREGKSVVISNGLKAPPMHQQYHNFIKHFPDKLEEQDQKRMEEEIVRKRIDNAIPLHLRKPSDQFKKRPAPGFLSDKHTYSTMRKISSLKSRKLFVFDSYTDKQKEKHNAAALEQKGQPVQSKSAKEIKTIQKKIDMNPLDASSSKQNNQELKMYHIYKGSNFENLNLDAATQDRPGSSHPLTSKREYMKPPARPGFQKPYIERKSAAMLHTMSPGAQPKTPSEHVQHAGLGSRHLSTENSFFLHSIGENDNQASGSKNYNNNSKMADSKGKTTMSDAEERHQLEIWMRKIAMKNEYDDKADVRDGIAETKGVKHRLNTGYGLGLKMVPREQNTKVYKMLKELRGYMQREQIQQQEIAEQNVRTMDIVDSEDEQERLSGGSDIIVSRPNPLEPRPKKKKKSGGNSNRDSKGHPIKQTVDQLFREQKQKNRESIAGLRMQSSQGQEQSRKEDKQYFD